MKLLHIKIHNIATVRDAEIDLEHGTFAHEPLILISGPTGAGKTTILDAICLSLYGTTPRLENVVEAKKNIFLEGFDKSGVTSKSPLHLVRRGASEASAALTFLGNDGKRYIATWSARRGTRGDKTLKGHDRSLQCLDTGETLIKRDDIAAVITRVVGLDFTRFCRTTMLAQGQFTRFLQCRDDERSDILMRLTNSERFNEVSRAIYERYADAKRACEEKKTLLDMTIGTLLTPDQIEAINAELALLTTTIEQGRKQAEADHAALTWHGTRNDLNKKIAGKRDEIERTLHAQYARCRSLTAALEQQLDTLRGTGTEEEYIGQINADIEACNKEIEAVNKKKHEHEVARDAIDLNALKRESTALDTQEGALNKIDRAVTLRDERAGGLQQAREAVSAAQAALATEQERTGHLLETQTAASEALQRAQEDLQRVSIGIEDATADIRSRLHAGDECPICGNTITALLTPGHFESALAPLRENVKRLTEAFHEASAAVKSNSQLIKSAEKELKAKQDAATAATTALQQAVDAITTLLATARIAADTADLNADIERRKDEIADARSKIEEKKSRRSEIQSAISALLTRLNDLNTGITRRSKQLDAFQTMLDTRAAAHDTVAEIDAIMPQWAGEHAVAAVSAEPHVELKKLTERLGRDVSAAVSALKTLNDELSAHLASAPQVQLDTPEQVAEVKQRHNDTVERLNEQQRQVGALNGKLTTDTEQRKSSETLREQLAAAQAELDRYTRLNEEFGGSDGKRLRNIALAFILGDLLRGANEFLRHFDGHYELYNEPGTLTIMLRDCQVGGVKTVSTNLSGGETFMVSLALALALARMGIGTIATDTLFIDEGFGSLSDDALERVIDTLERLHDMGGRRVVLISHVDSLRERIAAQLRVTAGMVTTVTGSQSAAGV